MAKSIKQKMGKFYIITTVGIAVVLLTVGKYFIHESGLEFIVLNSILGSVISSSIFITGFLLSGVFSDYKEADKIPSEIRSSLESILGEGDALKRKDPSFDNNKIRTIIKKFVQEFEEGLSEVNNHSHLDHAMEAIKDLDLVFDDMEARGVPPNYMTRIKSEQSHLRKMLLRVYHIQKTNFVPSVSVLVQSIVIVVIVLLAFVVAEVSVGIILFAVLSYLLIYTMQLIHVLEKPFRKGRDDTSDDVSIFLLRELSNSLDAK